METLYSKIYDYNNLYQAALKASEDKKLKYGSLRFFYMLEENIIELQNELIWHTYKVGKFYTFIKYEPKKREINALPFRDRVVQIALCNIIEPNIDKQFMNDSFACRKGRGKLAAANRLSYFMNKPKNKWYLKCDVHHFFKSIKIDILENIIQERYITDEETFNLIHTILLAGYTGEGIKIGNRFSQLAANIILNQMDFYCKETLHIKYIVRYMDDFIILGETKEQLQQFQEQIEKFLHNKLDLYLNKKTHIDLCKAGVDFVGYRIFPHKKIVKKQCINRMRNIRKGWENGKIKTEDFTKSLASRCGNATGTASYKFYMNTCLKVIQALTKRGPSPD